MHNRDPVMLTFPHLGGLISSTTSRTCRLFGYYILPAEGCIKHPSSRARCSPSTTCNLTRAQLGRTRTIALSLEPVWTNPQERFVVAVGLEDAARCDLTLEVWDEDDLGQGDFLGQVGRVLQSG